MDAIYKKWFLGVLYYILLVLDKLPELCYSSPLYSKDLPAALTDPWPHGKTYQSLRSPSAPADSPGSLHQTHIQSNIMSVSANTVIRCQHFRIKKKIYYALRSAFSLKLNSFKR